MKPSRKAVVLAAGLGTRLRPLTASVPKPLLPVWGEPMLSRILDLLQSLGVDDIRVNAHYLADQIERFCAEEAKRRGLAIKISREAEILGTGGVLNPLRDWIGDDNFYLVNGDIVLDGFNGFPDAERALARADVIGLGLVTETGPRTIEVEPASRFVTNWRSDDAGYPGTWTYCGLALLKSDILAYVPSEGFSSIVSAYEKALVDGRFLQAHPSDEGTLWTDAGTVSSFIDLNRTESDNAFAALPQIVAARAASSALGKPDDTVEFLGARGSDRAFFRSGGGIVIVYEDAVRAENARYAGHARFLAAQGVRVPSVLADLPEMKTLALAWAGEERHMSLEEYVKVVEALAAFNALGADGRETPPLEPPFDASVWKWERDLFTEHCLGTRFRRTCPDAVREELVRVAERLDREPRALVHRDFQASNVLWQGDKFSFIDFQGMRFGPGAYDLASLLYDPYAELTEGERRALAALYAKRAGREDIADILPFAAVERLVQCLGAFGRLASVGQTSFDRWVEPALAHLLAAADEAGLDAIGALAEDLIAAEHKTRASAHGHACSCGHDHTHHHTGKPA